MGEVKQEPVTGSAREGLLSSPQSILIPAAILLLLSDLALALALAALSWTTYSDILIINFADAKSGMQVLIYPVRDPYSLTLSTCL